MSGQPRAVTPAEAEALLPRALVLDVRSAERFARGHLPGSGHMAPEEFVERRAELPPREARVLVVGESGAQARAAAEALGSLELPDVVWLDAPIETLAGRGWELDAPAPLWRPSRFLEEIVAQIPRGRAIDVASGSGRDAVYLAMKGFTVEAWDSAPEALANASAMASRHRVAIETLTCDLERPSPPIPESRYRLVVCFRFLHRPLFSVLERALAPGGHLIYETFRAGQERFGRPRRQAFLLEAGELERAFPTLEVLRYEEPSPAGGPWTARLWARKP